MILPSEIDRNSFPTFRRLCGIGIALGSGRKEFYDIGLRNIECLQTLLRGTEPA